jgi:hypothetical protein
LITEDELRKAGALDVPPAWRKSLKVERDLFSGLFDQEHFEDEESTTSDAEEDEAADEE